MEYANLYIGNALVGPNASFQRVPLVGELVFFRDGYHRVALVGHTWTSTGQPIANVSLDASHALAAGPDPFPPEGADGDAI